MNRYLNPWYESSIKHGIPSKQYYENDAPLVSEYRGVKVFKLWNKSYDFVLNGVCLTQRAGITKYKETIDNILGEAK